MKDKLQAYWQMIIKNMDRSVLVIEGILLLAVVFIFIKDANTVVEQPQEPMPKPLETIMPNDSYNNVNRLFKTDAKLESDENARTLQEYNMFDYKIVKERETYMKEWDEKYKSAESLYNQGSLNESLEILKQILRNWPGHLKARELRKTIEAKLKPPETPSPTPSPVQPPAAAPGAPGAPPAAMGEPGLGF